jgi:hypothetical protein
MDGKAWQAATQSVKQSLREADDLLTAEKSRPVPLEKIGASLESARNALATLETLATHAVTNQAGEHGVDRFAPPPRTPGERLIALAEACVHTLVVLGLAAILLVLALGATTPLESSLDLTVDSKVEIKGRALLKPVPGRECR